MDAWKHPPHQCLSLRTGRLPHEVAISRQPSGRLILDILLQAASGTNSEGCLAPFASLRTSAKKSKLIHRKGA